MTLKYRKINENDAFLIEKWIALDPDHSSCRKEFFTKSDPGRSECFAVEDATGVIMYVKAENAIRLHIQFGPEKHRTAKALMKFIPSIEQLVKNRCTQLIWDSVSESLIKFTERFGYRRSPNEIIKTI